MAEVLQEVFFSPPIVVARLGGSTNPMAAYAWAQPQNPRTDGETVVVPQWTLRVLPDATLGPVLPTEIEFRDGDLIRPVCPFLELWARIGEAGSAPATWRVVPVTPAVLQMSGVDTSALRFRVEARNLKAARRMLNPDLGFGTFPAVEVRGDEHTPVALEGRSPPGVAQPLIPANRFIPLGSVQVIRSQVQPTDRTQFPWIGVVNVETIRLRFTPARGRFYGPPQAATATNISSVPSVTAANAFLNAAAGWFNQPRDTNPFVAPADTCDTTVTSNDPNDNLSLGVIDDTCEARVEVDVQIPGRVLQAHSSVFVGPPDFAPDRRPFLSIADELNDRSADAAARSGALTGVALDAWVEDLFERIYETASLLNVDVYRAARGLPNLSGSRLASTAIPGDGIAPSDQAMGSRDALRDRLQPITAATAGDPLPLSDRARMRHRTLSDVRQLKNFVLQSPNRMRQLVRGPFEVESGENGDFTTMRMPPFMRQSNALPLTLSAWQYELLMRWVAETLAPGPVVLAPPGIAGAAPELSPAAHSRREEVLRRLHAAGAQ